MKTFICLLLLVAMSVLAQWGAAQEVSSPDTTVYEVVEKWPEYPGGIDMLVKDARAYVDDFWTRKYPEGKPVEWLRTEVTDRRVVVTFIVDEDGRITNPVVTRSKGKELNTGAIRFIKSMPRWTPGEHKGRKVKVRFILPVQF